MSRRQALYAALVAALVLLWPELGVFAEPHAGIHDLLHILLFLAGFAVARLLPRDAPPAQEKPSENADAPG